MILGMDTFDAELLGQLLEWSPTVIATQDTAEKLASLGIKVDRIMGDNEGDAFQSDLKFVPTGDLPPVEAALKVLLAENYGAVNIVTDEFKGDDYVPFVPNINLVILHQHQKTYPISSGFTKWLPAGEAITLRSQSKDLISSGLSLIDTGKYITIADGVIKLEFDDAFVFISETI